MDAEPLAKYKGMELYNKELHINGTIVKLVKKETSFLEYMMQNPDKVLSREDFLKTVWSGAPVKERTIDVVVCYIKKKLPDDFKDIIKRSVTSGYWGYAFGYDNNENLTKIELKIKEVLSTNPGVTVPYEKIIAAIGYNEETYSKSTLRLHVCHLRNKIGEDKIIAEKNIGYKWQTPEEAHANKKTISSSLE